MKVLFFWEHEIASMLIEELFKDIFQDKLATKISYKIQIVEEMIWEYKPDIFFAHCHSESKDFERIKILTRKVFQEMPNCAVIITYHPDVSDDYKETFLKGYSCDLMLPEFSMSPKDINDIKNIYQKKTAHNTAYT